MKSGTEQLVLSLSERLVGAGYRVTLLVPDGERLDEMADSGRELGAEVARIGPLFGGNRWQRERTLARVASVLSTAKPDLLHMHYPYLYWHPRLVAVARLVGVRCVVRTEHNPLQGPASLGQRLLMRGADALVREIIFVSSDNLRKHQQFCGRPVEKCSVIYNAVDSETLRASATAEQRREVRARLGLPDDALIAVKIGAYDERQGYLDFVRAAAQVKTSTNLHFALIGNCPARETVALLAKELGIAERFHLLGNRTDVREILSTFDIYVQCSHYEGMAISMLEGLSAGLPMVTTRVDGVNDVFPDERGALFVDLRDLAGIAAGLKQLSESAELRQKLAATSQPLVRNQFTPVQLFERCRAVYERAIRNVPLSTPRGFEPRTRLVRSSKDGSAEPLGAPSAR
jgi:glycosyltransferase involved in cell wall biosynthesis